MDSTQKFLTKLEKLLREYDASLFYTAKDDGVHVSLSGANDINIGFGANDIANLLKSASPKSSKNKYYIVTSSMGVGLHVGPSLVEVRVNAIRELGSDNYLGCREATEPDIVWIRAMGGRIPPLNS